MQLYLLIFCAAQCVLAAEKGKAPCAADTCSKAAGDSDARTKGHILLQRTVRQKWKTTKLEGAGGPLVLFGPRIVKERSKVFIGIKTGPAAKYRERRDKFRNTGCGKAYTDAGFRWAFFCGVPMEEGHSLTMHYQGTHDTPHEQSEEMQLLNESESNGDMQFLMFRDQYMDLPNKLLGLLRFGYLHAHADYVMEHDDDWCANVTAIQEIIRNHEAKQNGKELWAGLSYFKGNEYPSMKGSDGKIAPYFSGHGSFLSHRLLKFITQKDFAHSVMNGFYGTNADDADLGKWVAFAEKKHGVQVDMVTDLRLLTSMGK